MIRSTIAKLKALRDVDPSGLADGDSPVWNATAGKFEFEVAGGGGGGGGGSFNSLAAFAGTGVDGDVVLDGTNTFTFATKSGSTYTLTRDLYADTLTIDSGCVLDNGMFRINAKTSITTNGTIRALNGAVAASGFTGGAWNYNNTKSIRGGNPGAAGGASGAGGNASGGNPGRGGSGGAGGAVGATAGGTSGTVSPLAGDSDLQSSGVGTPIFAVYGGTTVNSPYLSGVGGGGGASVDASHRGGGGGYAGGMLVINSPTIVNNGLITSPGGDGAASPSATNGGGGGGGGGGYISINTATSVTGSGTITAPGGAGGAGVGTGNNGASGSSGLIAQNVWS
jgi:hypothetical protein